MSCYNGSVQHVQKWLSEIDLQRYSGSFEKADVDAAALEQLFSSGKAMIYSRMKELGVLPIHIKKLTRSSVAFLAQVARKAAANQEVYRSILEAILADGKAAESERDLLARKREELGISQETHDLLLADFGFTEECLPTESPETRQLATKVSELKDEHQANKRDLATKVVLLRDMSQANVILQRNVSDLSDQVSDLERKLSDNEQMETTRKVISRLHIHDNVVVAERIAITNDRNEVEHELTVGLRGVISDVDDDGSLWVVFDGEQDEDEADTVCISAADAPKLVKIAPETQESVRTQDSEVAREVVARLQIHDNVVVGQRIMIKTGEHDEADDSVDAPWLTVGLRGVISDVDDDGSLWVVFDGEQDADEADTVCVSAEDASKLVKIEPRMSTARRELGSSLTSNEIAILKELRAGDLHFVSKNFKPTEEMPETGLA